MNNATILATLNHVGRQEVKPFVSTEWLMRMAEREDGCEISVGGLYTEMAKYSPTGVVDGDTEREPTKQEREVQAWRDSGGKADGLILTAQDVQTLRDVVDVMFYANYMHHDDEKATREVSRKLNEIIGRANRATTPNTENPTEPASLPESGAIGQECGKVSGGAENEQETGEISELRFRLKIAEDGWTRARFDTDRMTREIEGLRDEVRRLKGEEVAG